MSLSTGLKFHLKCNEESGTRVDSRGGFDFTENNTVGFTAGKFDSAANFVSANSEWLSHPYTSNLSVSGHVSFLFCAWISTPTPTLGQSVASHYQFQGGQQSWALSIQTSGKVTMNVGSVATSVQAIVANTPTFVMGWHDADNDVVGLRVNGTETTAAHSTGVADECTRAFRIGARGDNTFSGTTSHFDGWIDSASFWKGTIPNASERAELYNAGDGIDYPFDPGLLKIVQAHYAAQNKARGF